MGWGWWVVAGVLGLWLVILLATAGSRRPVSPLEAKGQGLPKFDTTAADAFRKRHDVRAAKPSAPAPPRLNQAQRE